MPVINTTNPGGATQSPIELVNWAFENARDVARSKSATSDSMFTNALNGAGSAPTMSPAPFLFAPDVLEPPVTIPTDAQGASVAKFYELSQAVINQLADLFSGYMTKYFPDDTPYLQEAQNWIVKALTVGGTGLNANVEDQMWQRDRSRITRDSLKAEEEAIATWAARRYPLPPGAATYQVMGIRGAAADQIAESSRSLAIKQMEIEIDNTKFAVEQAIKLYSAAMNAAVDYVKALSVGPASGMQIIPSITDSQSKLIGAANQYYQSRIAVEELRMKAAQVGSEHDQAARAKNVDALLTLIKERVDAAIAAAQSMGTQAASALNSLHAAASGSYQGSASNSVQYQYSNETSGTVAPIGSFGV